MSTQLNSSSISSVSSSTPNLSLEGSRLQHGHVMLGLVFVIAGLWHLYNQIKIKTRHKTFKSLAWFPTKYSRYLEPYISLIACSIYASMELYFSPFDHDGTFNATHIHHIEHACIAMAFFIYALFSVLLDKFRPSRPIMQDDTSIEIGHLFGAMAFGQELLLIHFHTTDHVGLEGQYHVLLQLLLSVCVGFSLLSIWLPNSFMVCYIRSLAIIFHGLWLFVMGIMLWTPEFAPKGCLLLADDHGRDLVTCTDEESLHRAKALVNIVFSFVFCGILCFGAAFYLLVNKVYELNGLVTGVVDFQERDCRHIEDMQGFLNRKQIPPFDLEE